MYIEKQEQFETLTRFISREMETILRYYPEFDNLDIRIVKGNGYADIKMSNEDRIVGYVIDNDGYYRESNIDLTEDEEFEKEQEDALSIAMKEGLLA